MFVPIQAGTSGVQRPILLHTDDMLCTPVCNIFPVGQETFTTVSTAVADMSRLSKRAMSAGHLTANQQHIKKIIFSIKLYVALYPHNNYMELLRVPGTGAAKIFKF